MFWQSLRAPMASRVFVSGFQCRELHSIDDSLPGFRRDYFKSISGESMIM